MAATEFRQACPTCKSRNNLCYFKNDAGNLISKCQTPGCIGLGKGQYYEQHHHYMRKELTTQESPLIEGGEYKDLEGRGITADTCQTFFYQTSQVLNL